MAAAPSGRCPVPPLRAAIPKGTAIRRRPRRAGAAAPLPEFAGLHAGSLGGRWPRLRVRRHRRGDGMRATRGRGRERVVHRGRGAGGGGGRFAVTTRRLTRLCSNSLAGSSLCRPRTHPHVPATPAPTARPQGGALVTKTRARLLVAVSWRHLEPPALRICATVPLSRESGLRFVPHLDEPAEGPTQERGRGAQNRKRPLSDPAAHSRGRPRSCAPFWKRGPESDASRLPPRSHHAASHSLPGAGIGPSTGPPTPATALSPKPSAVSGTQEYVRINPQHNKRMKTSLGVKSDCVDTYRQ